VTCSKVQSKKQILLFRENYESSDVQPKKRKTCPPVGGPASMFGKRTGLALWARESHFLQLAFWSRREWWRHAMVLLPHVSWWSPSRPDKEFDIRLPTSDRLTPSQIFRKFDKNLTKSLINFSKSMLIYCRVGITWPRLEEIHWQLSGHLVKFLLTFHEHPKIWQQNNIT
jgi:hypothetical protein